MFNASFPKPGETFADRYEVEKVLNRGGFAQVIRAVQTDLGRTVAIKILKPVNLHEDSPNRDERLNVIVKRFELEAQTVSLLNDSHTIRVFEYGSTPSGLLFMVMEYVPGDDISTIVKSDGAIDPERVVRITDQVLCSLAEAHTMELLHRDVKPANIMVYDNVHEKDCVKLLDFGLVKSMETDPLFTDENPGLTGDDNIVGTPRYMAPEQIRGDTIDGRSDLYSLGLVMYEMLTGERALDEDTAMRILAVSLNDENIALPSDTEVPPVLRRIVNTLLEKDPEKRPESAQAVRAMLHKWNDHEEPIPVAVPISESVEMKRPVIAVGRWAAIAAIAAVLMIIGGVAFFSNGDDRSLGTDVEATTVVETVEEGFEFEESTPEEQAFQFAIDGVRNAIPDVRMLEIAMNSVGKKVAENEAISEKSTEKKKKKRRKKKKKKDPESTILKIRTLDGKKK